MVAVRLATVADLDSVIELRMLHLGHFGSIDEHGSSSWRATHRRCAEARMGAGTLLAAVVEFGDEIVASGIAELLPRLPTPENPDGTVGHLSSMFTVPHFRRRGCAKLVTRTLVDELLRRGVRRIELNVAKREAEALYLAEGFTVRRGVRSMRFSGQGAGRQLL